MSTQPFTQSTATLAACKLVAFKSPSEARGKKQTQGLQVLAAAALVEARNAHHLSADDITDFLWSRALKERFSHILKFGREHLLDGLAVSRKRCKEYIRGSLPLFAVH